MMIFAWKFKIICGCDSKKFVDKNVSSSYAPVRYGISFSFFATSNLLLTQESSSVFAERKYYYRRTSPCPFVTYYCSSTLCCILYAKNFCRHLSNRLFHLTKPRIYSLLYLDALGPAVFEQNRKWAFCGNFQRLCECGLPVITHLTWFLHCQLSKFSV